MPETKVMEGTNLGLQNWSDIQVDDYWTEDDEKEDGQLSGEAGRNGEEGEEHDDEEDYLPEWLKEFEAERAKLEDVGGKLEEFDDRPEEERPLVIPAPAPFSIRKQWAIHDSQDVSDFDVRLPVSSRAMVHEFELDDFQKRAVLHVENHEHVFVCAHTSAGKTVVAEYAIALAAKKKLRAIYTSPIKALSNQKYREFTGIFPSVGIITGEVSVNTEAQCLIMTTEILRSLLYRNDPLISQVDVVIYDEVHYVNDPERGVVWEETIIMLPPSVSMVMLSATVPNFAQFADWVGRTKEREIFTVMTNHRPTPLQHFLWANDRAYLLMDNRSNFNINAYNMVYTDARLATANKAKQQELANKKKAAGKPAARGALRAKQPGAYAPQPFSRLQTPGARDKTEKQKMQKFFEFLQEREGLPVVCFCFSRKKCQQLASAMPDILNIPAETKSKSHVFLKQAFQSLSAEDKQLPQIKLIEGLVSQGYGIHHGGLLPIVKEAVEILFSKQLIQVLFATETFAMGVNMPARTVLLTSITKHDGRRTRTLHAAEYTQIAGRAGRRGLDKCGNVYILSPSEGPPPQNELTGMMLQRSTPLVSQFRLTMAMLLQLHLRPQLRPLEMISRSFRENLRAQQLPILKRDLIRKEKKLAGIPTIDCIFGEPDIEDYVKVEMSSRYTAHLLLETLAYSHYAPEVFAPGRLARLHSLPMLSLSSYYGVILSASLKGGSSLPLPTTTSARESLQGYGTNDSAPASGPGASGRLCNVPTFECLVLLPLGATLLPRHEDGSGKGDEEAQDRLALQALTHWNGPEDVSGIKAVLGHTGQLPSASLNRHAQPAQPGRYQPAVHFAVVKNVQLTQFATLLNGLVDLPNCDWMEAECGTGNRNAEGDRERGRNGGATQMDEEGESGVELAGIPDGYALPPGFSLKKEDSDSDAHYGRRKNRKNRTTHSNTTPPMSRQESKFTDSGSMEGAASGASSESPGASSLSAAAGVSAAQVHYLRCAQVLEDFLQQHVTELTPYVIPKKMKNIEIEHVVAVSELKRQSEKLVRNKCHLCPKRETNTQIELERQMLQKEIELARYRVSDASLDLIPDMAAKNKLLLARGYLIAEDEPKTKDHLSTNESAKRSAENKGEKSGEQSMSQASNFLGSDVPFDAAAAALTIRGTRITLKGRVACELLIGDEITFVEGLFGNVFKDLPAPALAAVVSAFIFPEKCEDEQVAFCPHVERVKQELEEIHEKIADEMTDLNIVYSHEDWARNLNCTFAHIAYRWATGIPFKNLMEKTTLQEGQIVRTMVRLEESLRKLKNVAHLIGDFALKATATEAQESIHRDIIFAASLYLK